MTNIEKVAFAGLVLCAAAVSGALGVLMLLGALVLLYVSLNRPTP